MRLFRSINCFIPKIGIDREGILGWTRRMKTRQFVLMVLAVTFAFAPQTFRTSTAAPGSRPRYSARLISPVAGTVLTPGQVVRVEWESTIPHVDLSWCEVELYLSLDGGRSNFARITPQLDPRMKFYNWVVPNTPTNAAVLDIHFGCEGYFPETPSIQSQSVFVIAR